MRLAPVALTTYTAEYDLLEQILVAHEDDAEALRQKVVESFLDHDDQQAQTMLGAEYRYALADVAIRVCTEAMDLGLYQAKRDSMPAALAIDGIVGVLRDESVGRLEIADELYGKRTSAPFRKEPKPGYFASGPMEATFENTTETGKIITGQDDFVPGTVAVAIREAMGQRRSFEGAATYIIGLLAWEHLSAEQRNLQETTQARLAFEKSHPIKTLLQRRRTSR